MPTPQMTVYQEREGLSSKMPLINRVTSGCSPNVVLSPSVIIAESAERAVLIALYPKPCLKRDMRNSRPS